MHEINHGIWNAYGIDNIIPGEENWVTALSHTDCQLIRDNPDLMAFLAYAFVA